MRLKNDCPICNSPDIKIFLTRKDVPVHQNLLMHDRQSAMEINRGDLILAYCEKCGFVYNQAYDPSKLCYSSEYDNTQTCSPLFDSYLSNLSDYLVKERGVQQSRIIEVGCGKGHFLKRLVGYEYMGNTGYGFDPSYIGPETELNGRLTFKRSFYNAECANIPADIVVCRHVIEHIPDPLALLNAIRGALKFSPQAKVFFETPCLEWILRNQVIWDFFYEHCSYFNADSLIAAFEISGFDIERVQHAFGGQYLWIEASVADLDKDNIHLPQGQTAAAHPCSKLPGIAFKNRSKLILELAQKFAESELCVINNFRGKIKDLSTKGGIALWGAGAKGVTLANLVDHEGSLINCVIDINPKKQGKYVPGTGHPIVSYKEIRNYGIKNIILMNPNYYQEILKILEDSGIENVKLVDLVA
jgi:SAM-dependent methyltransferase